MKKFALFLLVVILPGLSFGQLFPNVPDFMGNIKKVVEKRYGKEVNTSRRDSGVFKSGTFSGHKYIFLFDGNSKLVKRINTFHGKVTSEYTYQTQPSLNRKVVLERIKDYTSESNDQVVEYENFTDDNGRVWKVNFWSNNSTKDSKELFLFEDDAQYDKNRLISFIRHNINVNGDTASGEKCSLFYDSSDRLVRIERKDIESGFKTELQYDYNERGWVNQYSIDLLMEVQEYGKDQLQDIYFRNDRHGNWTRMYLKSGKKNRMVARRKIRYF